jgi:hypothetical protein
MTSWANVKEKIKTKFQKKPNYKLMYELERSSAESWEFKYNKLYRQLGAIIKESDNGET